ncbi:hypothetical protein ACIBEJ_33870 [Nonomuraea sp. NPDC050790]|uniref:hypothetical protein n=1 Tax=Nonomuraea sp. NPDC050790 TaxID=3364371 RepID=UPI0037B0F87F
MREVFDDQLEGALAWLHFQVTHGQSRGSESHLLLAADIVAYLRDEYIGPAPTGQVALIRLQAIQVAFLIGGWSLRWETGHPGSRPRADGC